MAEIKACLHEIQAHWIQGTTSNFVDWFTETPSRYSVLVLLLYVGKHDLVTCGWTIVCWWPSVKCCKFLLQVLSAVDEDALLATTDGTGGSVVARSSRLLQEWAACTQALSSKAPKLSFLGAEIMHPGLAVYCDKLAASVDARTRAVTCTFFCCLLMWKSWA